MTKNREDLVKVLKKDLDATKVTLKAIRTSARDEIAVLKDLLDAALKREKELVKISEKKAKKMLIAGER
ncbi:MAG: ribosome recycling factor [Gammaproteobacteria bacterium]